MAFNVANQASVTKHKARKSVLLITGSFALGGGVWSMHFLGMLALELCTPVSYDISVTMLSALPGVAASWVALHLLTKRKVSVSEIVQGGVLMGSGIGCMHYIGMAAMDMAPLLRYDLPMFLLSVVVAVVLAVLSLWIKFGINVGAKSKRALSRHIVLASVVMGLAIAGMHYTGMAAARFVLPPGFELTSQPPNITTYLAVATAVVTTVLIASALGVSLLFKYRDTMTRAIESERVQRALTNTAVDAIITFGDDGIIRTANPAAGDVYGYTVSELVGMHANELLVPERRHLYGPDFFKKTSFEEDRTIGRGLEAEVVRKGGERIPVRAGIGHTRINGRGIFVSLASDMRKRKAIENKLRESEAKFRSLIANIPGMAYRKLANAKQEMTFLSDAVKELTGYEADDFTLPDSKRCFASLYHPDDSEYIKEKSAREGTFILEYRIITKDGEVKWVIEQGVIVNNEHGEAEYIDGFISDITPRKNMENALKAARDKAQEAAAARAAFLANMSHEIRTPMNAIIGFSDLMLIEATSQDQKGHLTTINRSARSLLHLLNDILDSAKLDKGKLDIELREFSLREELDLVISTFWLEAKRKHVDLRLSLNAQLVDTFVGAPERIRQVLNNLIGNAVKFTHEGEVVVSVYLHSDDIYFEVADTGIGMTKEQVERVFDPFSQADASMSRKYGGTGLGTTISKQLVELMGGSISVSSEENKGPSFTFSLPLEPVEAPVKTKSSRSSHSNIRRSLKVLVADDVQQNTELLTLFLTRAGHEVTSAEDGEEALEMMKEQDFDIVLMDLQMPKLDGLRAAKQRRQFEKDNKLVHVPMIALTASVLVEDRLAAKQAGMEGFANKPVDFAALMHEVARVLEEDTNDVLSLEFDKAKSPDGKELLGSKVISSQTTGVPHNQDIVDLARATLVWGDEKTVLLELSKFLNLARDKLTALGRAVSNNHSNDAIAALHALKGTSGNLCLTSFYRHVKTIESQALKHQQIEKHQLAMLKHDLDDIASCIATLSNANKNVHTYSEGSNSSALADSLTGKSAESILADNAVLTEHVVKLKQSLLQNMIDESELVFLRNEAASSHEDAVVQILFHIDNFDFKSALQHVDELLTNLES
ncbi:MAG: MHYT domain-containing protein [Alteromonas sp.]|jgi:PAS domain S-box-containing protein|uniref:MHYT domain-containing protein n=1 Tax=Alteromonas sp. TaxID=232 RepID=UPI0032D9162B